MSADTDGQPRAAGARAHPSLAWHPHSRLRARPRPHHLTPCETLTPESPLGALLLAPGPWSAGSLALLWLEWEGELATGPSRNLSISFQSIQTLRQPQGTPSCGVGSPLHHLRVLGSWAGATIPDGRSPTTTCIYSSVRNRPLLPSPPAQGDSEQCLSSEGHISDLDVAFRLQLH